MDLGIAGRVALVTASSKRLGRSSALALAQEGVKVSICARGEDALRATDGITINLACADLHATDRMRELGGGNDTAMGDPDDFGKVVAFLCSEPANFVSGAALQVDGARTIGLL